MDLEMMKSLPGGEIVAAGLSDLAAGRDSIEAAAVSTASARLRGLGIDVPPTETGSEPPAHHLYDLLSEELGNAAHSRYNAIVGRLVSFARAAGHAGAR